MSRIIPTLVACARDCRALEGILTPARPDSADNSRHAPIARQPTFYSKPLVPFNKLELHRIIGTGQFGQVRARSSHCDRWRYALLAGAAHSLLVMRCNVRHGNNDNSSCGTSAVVLNQAAMHLRHIALIR